MRRSISSFHLVSLLGLVLWAGGTLVADCAHLTSERQALYRQSGFAHGYIHGYEHGFHLGNEDFQLARRTPDITKLEEYREASKEYRAEFGSRQSFRSGYRNGLVVGYTDAKAGHRFRAIYEARIAAGQLNLRADQPSTGKHNRGFELGFMDGYRAGSIQGVGDGRNGTEYRPQQAACRGAKGPHVLGESYCTGYFGGFRFGYSDGYINNDRLEVVGKDGRQTILTAAKE